MTTLVKAPKIDPNPATISDGPITTRPTTSADLAVISALHARAFGPGRFARTAYRLREQARSPLVSPHCRTARDSSGQLAGAVTMTAITIGDSSGHWLLGPLAVSPSLAGKGLGRRLVAEALASIAARSAATAVVVLVGDTKYYCPIGFVPVRAGSVLLPGPVDPARILAWLGPDVTRAAPEGLIRADLDATERP